MHKVQGGADTVLPFNNLGAKNVVGVESVNIVTGGNTIKNNGGYSFFGMRTDGKSFISYPTKIQQGSGGFGNLFQSPGYHMNDLTNVSINKNLITFSVPNNNYTGNYIIVILK